MRVAVVTRLAELLRRPLGLALALQIGWWVGVGGAAHGWPLAGPVVIALLLFVQTRGLDPSVARATFGSAAILAVLGTGLDSLQAAGGLLTFAHAPAPWLAPLWITALWAHFATAIDPLDRLCGGRWWALALCGAIGGPLAYLGGVRLGAATLHPDLWPSVVSLAVEWGLALPLASRLRPLAVAPDLPRPEPRPA